MASFAIEHSLNPLNDAFAEEALRPEQKEDQGDDVGEPGLNAATHEATPVEFTELLAETEAIETFSGLFGESVLAPDGSLDRAALAALAFDPDSGAAARKALEDWTHPRVRARILARIEEARSAGVPRVVLDVPLLLETDAQSGLARLCHVLVFVAVSDELRDRRAQEQRSWPPGEVARREAAQLPLKLKEERADYVLSNETNLADLERACRHILARIEAETD